MLCNHDSIDFNALVQVCWIGAVAEFDKVSCISAAGSKLQVSCSGFVLPLLPLLCFGFYGTDEGHIVQI